MLTFTLLFRIQTIRMFDVGGQKGERRKWIQVFDGISAILFLISASEFDLMTREVAKQFSYEKVYNQAGLRFSRSVSVDKRKNYRENRMLDSLRLFQDICDSRFLEYCGLICFLNKQDQLRDKIVNRKCNLSDYFEDYASFEYEPKVNWLAELSGSSDRRNHNLRAYWRSRLKNGSREGSINSAVVLDQFGSTDVRTQQRWSDVGESDSITSAAASLCPASAMASLGAVAMEAPTLSLELEYRKARNFIKNKFVRVADQTAEKRHRKQQGVYSSALNKKSVERECFFHYTIATDTENIRTVFDDVQVMIILNNINQTILN
jgi:hypothetical protein